MATFLELLVAESLEDNMVCCRDLSNDSTRVWSPFCRLIATEYYDGPTAGIVECGVCQRLFSFSKIDWDDGQNNRLFLLSDVVINDFDKLWCRPDVGLSGRVWLLDPARDCETMTLVENAVRSSSPSSLLIAAANSLLDVLLATRWVSGLCDIHHVDWLKEFNIPRHTTD